MKHTDKEKIVSSAAEWLKGNFGGHFAEKHISAVVQALYSTGWLAEQPSDTQMHADTKECSYCKSWKKLVGTPFCPECGGSL